jgi:hypothetical protein
MTRATLALLGCLALATGAAFQVRQGNARMTNTAEGGDCEAALRLLSAGDLVNWRGLPANCDAARLSAVFTGGGDPAGNGRLSTRPTRFRNYRAAGQPQPLQAWFDEQDRAILVTWVQPTIRGSVKDLLAALGTPEKKLDPTIGYHADAYQWIYAARGLTLYVREADWTLARVSVYPPTTAEVYEDRLGAHDQREYLRRER